MKKSIARAKEMMQVNQVKQIGIFVMKKNRLNQKS